MVENGGGFFFSHQLVDLLQCIMPRVFCVVEWWRLLIAKYDNKFLGKKFRDLINELINLQKKYSLKIVQLNKHSNDIYMSCVSMQDRNNYT